MSVPTRYIKTREPYSKTLEVETNDPANPLIRLTLRFTIRDVLLIKPDLIELGKVKTGSVIKREVKIANKGGVPIKITKISLFPQVALKAELKDKGKDSLAPGASADLAITFEPKAPDDRFMGVVQVETDYEKIPVKNIQVKAQVVGE